MDEVSVTTNPEIQTVSDDTPVDTSVNNTEYFLDYEDTTGATDLPVSQGMTLSIVTEEVEKFHLYLR